MVQGLRAGDGSTVARDHQGGCRHRAGGGRPGGPRRWRPESASDALPRGDRSVRNAPPLTTENQLGGVVVDALDRFLQFAERAAAVDGKGFVLLEARIGETHQPGRNLVGGRRARPRYRGCGQGRFSGSLMVPGSLTPRDRRARFACVSPIPPRWRPYRTRHCPAGLFQGAGTAQAAIPPCRSGSDW